MKTNLQTMRKRAGFKSAKAFAEHVGISKDTYTGYEQGRIQLTLERAWEFADELHCTLDELAGRDFRASSHDDYADALQTELNECYVKMNESARSTLVDTARMMSAAPEARIVKDGEQRMDGAEALGA